jgi:hypothetical protein
VCASAGHVERSLTMAELSNEIYAYHTVLFRENHGALA